MELVMLKSYENWKWEEKPLWIPLSPLALKRVFFGGGSFLEIQFWLYSQWALSDPSIKPTLGIPMKNYHCMYLYQKSVCCCCLLQFIILNLWSRVEWSNVFFLILCTLLAKFRRKITSFSQKHPECALLVHCCEKLD